MLYKELAEVYDKLEKTSKRLEKTEIIANFLNKIKKQKEEISSGIIYLLRGRIFPDYDERETGISSQLAIKIISKATGISSADVNKKWKSLGDLGKVAEELAGKKRQATLFREKLSVDKVLHNLRGLIEFTGKGTVDRKIGLIAELLASASPLEAKYIVRTLLGDLRIGLGEGVLRDAIVWSCFGKENKEAFEKVQTAYDSANDFAVVFEKARKGLHALESIEIEPGRPVKVMLALKVDSIEEGFEEVGKNADFEFKYDGFRLMINKTKEGRIYLFTRRLENVTKQFPEVIDYVKKNIKGKSFIIDSEAVGYDFKTKKYKPFQEISQRIKRKYDIEKLSKELPVEVNVFDILYYNGKSMIKEPFKKRRELLEKIVRKERFKIKLSESLITDDAKKAEEFYKKAIEEGEEGLMIKKLDAPYKPGARVGYMLKLKPKTKEFDLVIIGAEYGTGKRAGWLSSYSVACVHEGRFLEIGKVSTGLKEKEEEGLSFVEMTRLLKPLIIEEHGRDVKVKPRVVVSVIYQNIQKSPTYNSGYALRFPRIVRLRPDRSVKDIAFLKEVEKEAKKEHR
ncbi:ATP-dependent DNA ligase [Candidatus Pacearchaeota archaeon]|nr:ATP-dependent DNA ligase [Candidatus Pacearchaeota archaeon]